jgi:yecA family protein
MRPETEHDERTARPDPAPLWMGLLASPAAPKCAMSALELDGYLTGIIVAPSPIRPSLWMAGIWDDEPDFDDMTQVQSVFEAVGLMFNTLSTGIERSLQRLEAERICDYRPAFQPIEGKPSHEAIRIWARGFWRAMELAPAEWSALAADERLKPAGVVRLLSEGQAACRPSVTDQMAGAVPTASRQVLKARSRAIRCLVAETRWRRS